MRLATLGSVRLPNHSVRLMCGLLGELGCNVSRALAVASVPESAVADPEGTVSGLQELAFQLTFLRMTPDRPDVWLELGSRYRLLSHAHSAYALMMSTAPSVEASIRVGLRYGDLYYMLAEAEGIFDESGRQIGFRSLFTEMPDELRRFAALRDVAVNCAVFSDLYGGAFPFDRVELPLPESDAVYVRRYLPDSQLMLGAAFNCWRWSNRADLRRPPQSDSMLHEFYRSTCDRLQMEAHRSRDLIGRVAELLSDTQGQLSLKEASARLGVSARTLQRRLESRGMNYRDLSTLRRHQNACRLLTQSDAPISRIALEVGYDNVSSFNFAFRRHSGTNPSRYRSSLRQGG